MGSEACWALFRATGEPVFYLLYCRAREQGEQTISA